MFFVYILFSDVLGKYYVGQINDVSKRLDEHNNGKSKFTTKGIPWKLIHIFECTSRIEAVNLEMKIKKRGIKRYLQDNQKF